MDTTPGYIKVPTSSGDSRFPSFLQGFNRRWYAPGCLTIYLPYTTSGAALALEDAITNYGSAVRFKSGGHCYEDFVYNSDTLAIIDITPMDGYGIDPVKGYYLEAGLTNWSSFQAIFRDYGKVLPAGSCYSVGLGGHICGGGYGLLSRLNGLTVDWLTGVDMIVKDSATANAYPIYVGLSSTDPAQKDLYWASLGGGGGNFGLITRYYFANLPDAPDSAYIIALAIPWSDLTVDTLTDLLNWYYELASDADNWRLFGLLALNHQANEEIHLTIQTAILPNENKEEIKAKYLDPLLASLQKITPWRRMTRPGLAHQANLLSISSQATVQSYTFYEVVQLLNGSGANQRGKYKSAYMRKPFPPDQIAAIYKWLTTIPPGLTAADMQQSLLQVDTYGGQINLQSSTATAIPQRSSIFKLQYQTYWADPDQDAGHLGWIRGFYSDVYAQTGGVPDPTKDPTNNVDGCYYNYPDVDLNGPTNDKQQALKLYFGNNLPRLQKTKARWDPNNYFNSSQSI